MKLSNDDRAMHIAVLGKTGTGKSSLLRYLSQQDIEADRGFCISTFTGMRCRSFSARSMRANDGSGDT